MPANVKTMMYVGEQPWHGLGKKLDKPATSAEAIQAAELDWEVKKVPVKYMDLHGHAKEYPGKFVVRRQDSGVGLGVVGKWYTPMQNKDAFKFFDAVVGEKAAMYHTAGQLGDGERIWVLAKLPGDVIIKGFDKIEKFLLLMNSHDGTTTITVKVTPIRVVCENTLAAALSGEEPEAKLRHTRWVGQKIADVRDQIGLVNQWYKEFEKHSNFLASKPCSDLQFKNYLGRIGVEVEPATKDKELGPKTLQMLDDLMARFQTGKGDNDKQIRGTWWAAYNAVTEFTDHSPLFGRFKDLDNRARTILYGAGEMMKKRAWAEAVTSSRK